MRRVTFVTAAIALVLVVLVPQPAHAITDHRYVAVGLSSVIGGTGGETTAAADLGTVRITPTFDRITLTVNDDIVTTGTIRVVVNDRTPSARYLCVPAGSPSQIAGLRPGEPLTITVAGMAFATGCDSGGTTGLLTITQ